MNKQLFLFLMLLPMVASAYDETDGKLYYNLNKSDNTASVTYKGRISQDETYNDCSGDIVIPNEVTFGEITYRVTSIGKAAFCQCKDLTSVTISNSVTSIASSAFSGCTGLSNVILGDNVTSIAISAFYGCESLTSLIIPKNVTSIGVRAFSGCNCLESVIVENGNSKYDSRNNCNAVIETTSNTLIIGCPNTIIPNDVTTIGKSAFWGCNISSIDIPNSVTQIGDGAFSYCAGLTSLDIPASLNEIGSSAFSGCSSLASVNIPNNLISIGSYAFKDCTNLKSIRIPNSVTSIGNIAFEGCANLESIIVEEGNTVYDSREGCNAIIKSNENILIAGSKNTKIPDGVISIGEEAFYGCNGLTSINIPSSVTSIGTRAFQGCGLKLIKIPSGITSIGWCAFFKCNDLETVIVECVEPIALTNGDPYLSNDGNAILYVPKGSANAYANANGWKIFKEIKELFGDGDVFTAAVGSTTFKLKVLSAANKTCQVGADNKGDGLVSGSSWDGTIPSKVTGGDCQEYTVIGIGNRAFYEYDGIVSITLPETLQQISEAAFSRCHDLMYVTIPEGVTSMGEMIFNGQESLKEVVSMIKNPYVIDNTMFSGRYGNKATLVVPAGKKTVYENTDGWKLFKRIVEMNTGDANGNESVDEQDLNLVKEYIMTGKIPDGFVRKNADTKSDNKINVVDIVNIVNIIKNNASTDD